MTNPQIHPLYTKAKPSLDPKAHIAKRRLHITFDHLDYTIYINREFHPPISWFLTDADGAFVKEGHILDYKFQIDMTQLKPDIYDLRIAGEVHRIEYK